MLIEAGVVYFDAARNSQTTTDAGLGFLFLFQRLFEGLLGWVLQPCYSNQILQSNPSDYITPKFLLPLSPHEWVRTQIDSDLKR